MAINLMTIPTNTFQTSYSGMGPQWQNFSTQNVMPAIGNLLNTGMGKTMQAQAAPAMQSVINNLAGRNMINSSVASDTMAKAMQGISSQSIAQYPQLLTQLAGMGQYSLSQDPLEGYKLYASMLSGVL